MPRDSQRPEAKLGWGGVGRPGATLCSEVMARARHGGPVSGGLLQLPAGTGGSPFLLPLWKRRCRSPGETESLLQPLPWDKPDEGPPPSRVLGLLGTIFHLALVLCLTRCVTTRHPMALSVYLSC